MTKTAPFWSLAELVVENAEPERFQVSLEDMVSDVGQLADGSLSWYAARGTPFTKGDILFGKLRPYLAKYWLADRSGTAGGDIHVYRPASDVEPRFLRYIVGSRDFIKYAEAASKGVKMPRVEWMGLREFFVYRPNLATQQRIADYLDRETGEIDAMVAKMDQLAEQLEARRDSTWDAEFRDASTLGSTVKLSLLIESIADGPFGSSLTSAHYAEEGARVVRLGNIGINSFRDADKAFISLDYAQKLGAHAVVAGDVVVAGLGDERMPLGRATVLPDIGPAIVKADCYRVRPNKLVSAKYLAWALSAPQARSQFKLLSRGTTRARLNTKVVQEVQIPLITHDQQDRLLERQRVLADQTDQMLAKVAELKSLLTERRAALITEVVTGRKEVA